MYPFLYYTVHIFLSDLLQSFVNYENDCFVTHIANHYCQFVICLLTIFLETKCSNFSRCSLKLVIVQLVISLLFWFAYPRLMVFEHFLTCLLTICTSSLKKCPFKPLAYFSLLFLYYSEYTVFISHLICKNFLALCDCIFTFYLLKHRSI